jgi:hypothetical protein
LRFPRNSSQLLEAQLLAASGNFWEFGLPIPIVGHLKGFYCEKKDKQTQASHSSKPLKRASQAMETYTVESRTRLREVLRKDGLTIPFMQRNFSWKPDNVAEFMEYVFDDISNIEVYLGRIIVLYDEDSETRFIIDGQQRLVSLITYVASVALAFPNNEGIRDIVDKFLLKVRSNEPRLVSHYSTDNASIRAIIGGNTLSDTGLVAQAHRKCMGIIGRRYSHAEAALEEIESLINKLLFDVVVVRDAENAARIFEVINTKGERLTNYQRVKMSCMTAISKESDERKSAIHNRMEALNAAALPYNRSNGSNKSLTGRLMVASSEIMQNRVGDQAIDMEIASLRNLMLLRAGHEYEALVECLDKSDRMLNAFVHIEGWPEGMTMMGYLSWDAVNGLIIPVIETCDIFGEDEGLFRELVNVIAAHCVRCVTRPRQHNSVSRMSNELMALLPHAVALWNKFLSLSDYVSIVRRSLGDFHMAESADAVRHKMTTTDMPRQLAAAMLWFIEDHVDDTFDIVRIANSPGKSRIQSDVIGTYILAQLVNKRQKYSDDFILRSSNLIAQRLEQKSATILRLVP